MNPETLIEAKKIATSVKRAAKSLKRTEIVLCPPFIFLSSLLTGKSKGISFGAQDAFYESAGPYTGEVSSRELSGLGIDYIIIGHSERRARGESDETINKKVKVTVGDGMTAILCIGEKERDHQGEYLHFVKKQIISGLKDVSKKSLDRVVIAYEPVWAVGAREAMPPREVQEMSIFIKKVLRDLFGVLSDGVRVLYGGDVTVGNVLEIVRDGKVSGLLIGRESLKVKNFIEIAKIADSAK